LWRGEAETVRTDMAAATRENFILQDWWMDEYAEVKKRE
jgi:hypothetical protein